MAKVERRIDYVVIGRRLKQARKKSKMTQAKVAELIHVKTAYYSNLERGKDRINLERLIQLCVLYNVLPGDILNDCCADLLPIQSVDLAGKSADKDAILLMVAQCSNDTASYMNRACQFIINMMDHKAK